MKSMHKSSKVISALTICVLLTLGCTLLSSPTTPVTSVGLPSVTSTTIVGLVVSNTPQPSATEIPTGTNVLAQTPEPPSCYKWDQITLEMAGEVICVYGVAFSHQGQSRIDFSPEKNTFFLVDSNYFYPELAEGSCVVAKEEVSVFDDRIPFMSISGSLYKCEPWMVE